MARATALAGMWRSGACLLAAILLSGCATFSEEFSAVEPHLAAQRFDEALKALERQARKPRDRVLYLLNKGMVQRMQSDYVASNATLEEAKQIMERLYAASVSEQALSFVINDATRSYAGEEHEQVLLHLYRGLNHLQLGDLAGARVEALQADVRMREVAERLAKSKYAELAFVRYLTGLIYEELGEWSDALIAYRKAYEAYREQGAISKVEVPLVLKQDLLWLTERQGLREEHNRYQQEFGVDRWARGAERDARGEVVLVLHNGLAPVLRERSVMMSDPQSGHIVRISLPYLESRPPAVSRVELTVGELRAASALVENIDTLARERLEAKMPAITARAIARQLVKSQTSRRARENANQQGQNAMAGLFALAVEVGNVATERADTRSWVTLPHDIQLARLPLPPGEHTVRVRIYGDYNQLIGEREYLDVAVRAGHKVYLSYHALPVHLPGRRR